MVKHKVFRSGDSLVISLPNKFCKRNNICKGSRVEVENFDPSRDDALKISVVGQEEKEVEQ